MVGRITDDGDRHDDKSECGGRAWSENHFFTKQYQHVHAFTRVVVGVLL